MAPSLAQQASESDALHGLALKLCPGLGTRLAARLAGAFGDAQAIFRASPAELETHGVPPLVARQLTQSSASAAADEAAQQELERTRQAGGGLVRFSDSPHPE